MTTLAFFGFLASDFSSLYLDISGNTPNSLILTNGNSNNYNGIYNYIYLYDYLGYYIYNNYYVNIKLIIPQSFISLNNDGFIKYSNKENWIFSEINVNLYKFFNIKFSPIFLTKNSSRYNLINEYKGYKFPNSIQKWYTNIFSPTPTTFQLIWGQGDIPQEYYSICGFPGTINVKAQNPFTNSNGPYYSTYISTNNNYASNSGWIILLAGPYDSTLVNPPYLEDV